MEMLLPKIIMFIIGVSEGIDVGVKGRETGSISAAEEYRQFEESLLSDPRLVATVEVVDVTHDDVGVAGREKRSATSDHCPVISDGNKREPSSALRERSSSPWRFVREFDARRNPRFILKAKCLCDGCIDMETGEENRNMRSVPMYYPKTVVKFYGKRRRCIEIIPTPIACSCQFPGSELSEPKVVAKSVCFKRRRVSKRSRKGESKKQ